MKNATRAVAFAVFVLALSFVSYKWFLCRFYVEPGEMAIVIAKTGKDLDPGQILALPGQKGIQEQVLGEGRHFLDPFLYDHEIKPVVTIAPGKVGLVTSKVGKELPAGEFLAEPGEKGVWRKLLGPGRYRLNPYGYQVDVVDAISIPIGYVGVITSLSGSQAPEGDFAGAKQKGIRADILQPGLYYANPKEFKVDVLEIGVNQVSLLGKEGSAVVTKNTFIQQGANEAINALQQQALMEQQERRRDYLSKSRSATPPSQQQQDLQQTGVMSRSSSRSRPASQQPQAQQAAQRPGAIEPTSFSGFVLDQYLTFPSRDGFEISLDMTVEFELEPQSIAKIFRQFGDLPAVVDKIIMPQILSISRLKGSAYRATDFIIGEGREKFQVDLKEALAKTLGDRQIVVYNALIRHVDVPVQILEPIQQASIAQEQDLTNKEKQNTARKMAELNTETSMIQQKGQEVQQQTEKLKALIKADEEKKVAEIAAEAARRVAEIEQQTASVRAEKTLKLGEAAAEVVRRVDGETAKGAQLRTQAFGDPEAYSLWEFSSRLSPGLRINMIHAGEGTLWTDLQKAGLGDLGGAKILQEKSGK